MPQSRCTLLPAFSVIAVSGRDARTFLQGQLTSDLLGLERHPGLLAAACNREGRVLEILRLAAHGDTVLIVVRRPLVKSMIVRLLKFTLRAEVFIVDRGDALAVAGVMAAPTGGSWSQADAETAGAAVMVAGPQRQLLVGPRASLEWVLHDVERVSPGEWERICIEDGEPTIHPETAGLWIPQMLNLDLLSAVSFSKGCYVGQEIVARTQHLGHIKRRMLRFAAPAGASFRHGQALYRGESQAAQVVTACAGPHAVELLAVAELRFGSDLLGAHPGGLELVPADLPYPIPGPLA
ncbi:MAG: hypothetical protein WBO00_07405 [Steroidobacteraceae bacterium]